ncbi:MAG: MBL fold metallo-hydrolase [Bacteroidetes bacterium]|nr:MBL fold metallo-hydrolase [Bacteroidota bacterium]
MASVVGLTFNPFQENTYLVYDQTGECVIFDPGCYDSAEKEILHTYIKEHKLRPVRLINTHCHLDHIFGNADVAKTYDLSLEIHEGELPVLESAPKAANLYGIPMPEMSPAPENFIQEGDEITFGETRLKAILTPGHSPASLSFFCAEDAFLIAGDVLFRDSIGRTDLPGGDHQTLLDSISQKLYPLGDEVVVYPGHGPRTTIGYERKNNPFVRG